MKKHYAFCGFDKTVQLEEFRNKGGVLHTVGKNGRSIRKILEHTGVTSPNNSFGGQIGIVITAALVWVKSNLGIRELICSKDCWFMLGSLSAL